MDPEPRVFQKPWVLLPQKTARRVRNPSQNATLWNRVALKRTSTRPITIPFFLYRTVITEQYSMSDQSQQATLMELRTRAGLTRREVANALGITEKTIYVWETSDNPPKMTVFQVQKLLEILGCTLDELAIATNK